jgi:L-ribulose-5-phosphate 3-epimerase
MSNPSPHPPKRHILAATPTCFFGFDPWTAYRYFQRAGIRHVEVVAFAPALGLNAGLTTFAPESMDAHDVQAFRERLQSLQLTPLTVDAFCDPLDAAQLQALLRRIDFAQQLGARYILGDVSPDSETCERRRKLVTVLRWLGDYASERGVRIALETHEGLTRNGKLARGLLDEVDHPAVGYNYDTGNIYYYNGDIDPAEDIKEVAERVLHVHLKDTLGGKNQWQFCALGDGRVNFPKVIAALEAVGYDGPYSLEIEGIEGEDLTRQQILERILKSMEYLRRIGLQF